MITSGNLLTSPHLLMSLEQNNYLVIFLTDNDDYPQMVGSAL